MAENVEICDVILAFSDLMIGKCTKLGKHELSRQDARDRDVHLFCHNLLADLPAKRYFVILFFSETSWNGFMKHTERPAPSAVYQVVLLDGARVFELTW